MKTKRNIWKIVSLIFIALFVIVVAAGFLLVSHFRSNLLPPTSEQVTAAEAIVAQDLAANGDDIANYEVTVSPTARKRTSQTILQVRLTQNATEHLYLLDLESSTILVHSQTTVYGNLSEDPPFGFPGPPFFGGKPK